MEDGGGRSAASNLAGDVVEWQDNGDLTDRAALTALGLLRSVPGVNTPSSRPATTDAPTTAPPTTEDPATTIVVEEEPTIVITVPNLDDLLQGDGGGRKPKKGD